jgi:hypothetical protein
MDKPSLTPGARGAAEAYCDRNFPSISWSYATRRQAEEAFSAGYSAALLPPTPEEIEAAWREFDFSNNEDMGRAISAFLQERKR